MRTVLGEILGPWGCGEPGLTAHPTKHWPGSLCASLGSLNQALAAPQTQCLCREGAPLEVGQGVVLQLLFTG